MPVPFQKPMQWACKKCEWRDSFLQKSDVLLPSPECCPKCAGEIVLKESQTNSFWEKLRSLF
ncbi:hypothetical protein BKK51_08630 [Rodentibacter trehalosifermentans]|uniref:Uncharacterized protein n=1 Tax=Rodentibacter trehalosifermentans TaxID=1908263 RepID=A0A1V3J6H6_9PAST|nr:hypothetical protein BKK51_08630 [Rodentibacter trehalosifermentans]OOF48182.1 hypothetical protein BKK53_10030 [Rodentibacter trehalosifermentans]OOF50852.1 hypothetical protein BKK52_01530 [Rodentibacter trehalosifermentans]